MKRRTFIKLLGLPLISAPALSNSALLGTIEKDEDKVNYERL